MAGGGVLRARAPGYGGAPPPDPEPPIAGKVLVGPGWGGATPLPANPARTAAGKPSGHLLNTDCTPYTGDLQLITIAGGSRYGGYDGLNSIASVTYQAEAGVPVVITTPGFGLINETGVPEVCYGYRATLDWASGRAFTLTEKVKVAITIAHRNPAQANTVIIAEFYPRLTGVGAQCEIDKILYVDKDALSDTPDVRYRTAVAALNRCIANPAWYFPVLEFERDGDHVFNTATNDSGPRARYTRFRGATGRAPTLGDGSGLIETAGHCYDGMAFEATIKIDIAKISPNMAAFRMRTNSNKRIWFKGCEVTCGANTFLGRGSGAGMAALWDGLEPGANWLTTQDNSLPNAIYTAAYVHDLPAYGPGHSKMVRSCTIENIGGSCLENLHGAAVHNIIRGVGGILSGLRVHENASQITGPAGGEFEVTSLAGRGDRRFRCYAPGGAMILDLAISVAKDAVTQVSDIRTAVNALGAGWNMTASTATRAAAYLSMALISGAGAIVRQAVSSTPKQLTTFVDVHADDEVWHGRTYTGCLVAFNRFPKTVGAAQISVNDDATLVDCYLGPQEFADTSVSHNGMSGFSGSYLWGVWDNVTIEYQSMAGGSCGVSLTSAANSGIYDSHWNGIGVTGAPFPGLTIDGLSVRSGTVPTGSTNSKQQSGLNDAQLFTDVANENDPDLTPLNGNLQKAGGGWHGARLPKVAGEQRWQGAIYA